jgi:hypothetical protein
MRRKQNKETIRLLKSMARLIYGVAKDAKDGEFFIHLDLPTDITETSFVARYIDASGHFDENKLNRDVAGHEPTRLALERLHNQAGLTRDKVFSDMLEMREKARQAGNTDAVLEYDEIIANAIQSGKITLKH